MLSVRAVSDIFLDGFDFVKFVLALSDAAEFDAVNFLEGLTDLDIIKRNGVGAASAG
jgi:hypothetical protein